MQMIQNDLNAEQYKAVTQTDSPLLVLSGAGTGKTRVITYKIAYLCFEKGFELNRIAAFTFTNKAAQEMFFRTMGLLRKFGLKQEAKWNPYDFFIGTFHSNCLKILRRHASLLGYQSSFGVIDETDKSSLLKEIIKELFNSPEDIKKNIKDVRRQISIFKNSLRSPEDIYQELMTDFSSQKEKTAKIYDEYCKRLFQMNNMDFDDLIINVIKLLNKDPSIKSFWKEQFRYILIDEFQDTNHSQLLLLTLLTPEDGTNVSIVGDDDQSIYSFRGAKIGTILNLDRQFKSLCTIKLERNYRSSQAILNIANCVIEHNQNRIGKQLYSHRISEDEDTPLFYQARTENQELDFVFDSLSTFSFSNHQTVGIIYRTNAQSRSFEMACQKRGISYKILGGSPFFERKEVKDMTAYLKLINNPQDDLSLKRIINVPTRGIGATTVQKIDQYAKSQNTSILGALENVAEWGKSYKIKSSTILSLQNFWNLMKELTDLSLREPIELVNILIDSIDYMKYLSSDDNERERQENIEELKRYYQLYFQENLQGSFSGFIQNINLQDKDTFATEGDSNDNVSHIFLTTVHASKGLEFDYVFVVGLAEHLFPHTFSIDSHDSLEEEYRLFYVAVTRAKTILRLSYSQEVFLHGHYQYYYPSQFLDMLSEPLIRIQHS